jgi:hypothetical protein
MADKNPYGLRNADIENLDLSEFAKDFSADELAAVRAGLLQKRQQQQEQFNALPVFDQAKIYAGEKFGEVKKAVEDNPELLLGVLAGKAALDVGSSAVEKTKSLYDRMINKPSDSLGAPTPQTAPQTTPAATTEIPSVEAAAQQAAQQAAAEGKIKTGKAGGSITPQEGAILEGEASGKVKAEVSDVVKGPVVPKAPVDVPEGRIASYPNPKRNKQGKDVIGQGGWHWYQGQMGPEAEKQWLTQFGRTNQTYADVKQAIKEGRLQGAEVKEGKGGSFPREATVPNYIRGSAPVEAMARTGLGALGIMPVAKKIQEGDYKGALNELIPAMAMISPSLSLAASPLYTSDEEIAILKKAEQGRKVGAGRGIAPPSAYMR